MKLIFLGPPGAGKGTQSAIVSEKLSIPTISTGDILRASIAAGTEDGELARSFMDEGHLVPDELVLRLVAERVSQPDCVNGYILDGMPRTIAQAEALEKAKIHFDHVLSIECADEVVLRRLTGRRVCPNCHAIYHVENHPTQAEGVCDLCGSAVEQRVDDTTETVSERLAVYHERTEPLKDFYLQRGLLRRVDVIGSVEEITQAIMNILEEK